MPITVMADIVIHALPGRVFSRLCDVESWPQWGSNLVSMKKLSEGPLQVGSQLQQVAKGGRNPAASILEVYAYVPDQSFGIKGLNLEGVFTLEPVEADTRLHARFTVETSGLAALMYRLLLKRYVVTDLRTFKRLIESGRG
ncbi:MAG: SRPBCC family protein [Anaerolineae bacterium]